MRADRTDRRRRNGAAVDKPSGRGMGAGRGTVLFAGVHAAVHHRQRTVPVREDPVGGLVRVRGRGDVRYRGERHRELRHGERDQTAGRGGLVGGGGCGGGGDDDDDGGQDDRLGRVPGRANDDCCAGTRSRGLTLGGTDHRGRDQVAQRSGRLDVGRAAFGRRLRRYEHGRGRRRRRRRRGQRVRRFRRPLDRGRGHYEQSKKRAKQPLPCAVS